MRQAGRGAASLKGRKGAWPQALTRQLNIIYSNVIQNEPAGLKQLSAKAATAPGWFVNALAIEPTRSRFGVRGAALRAIVATVSSTPRPWR